MDDLRRELREAFIAVLIDEAGANETVESLLAAGWTRPPVAQQVEPAAHEGLGSAAFHAMDLEQCAMVVDSGPLSKAMLDAAAFLRSFSTQKPPSEPAPEPEDAVGAAERQVGRYVYRRISRLMDAAPGTPEGAELLFLANIASQVEEYGEQACGDHDLSAPAPAVQEQELRRAVAAMLEFREPIEADLRSAHSNRGNGASEWMRENDREFCREVSAVFNALDAALRTQGGE